MVYIKGLTRALKDQLYYNDCALEPCHIFSHFCFKVSLKLLSFLVREFGRWKVKNMALESKEFPNLTLAPEFVRTIRQLGRRPSAAQITENLIKKYGTHILLSAVLGGEFTAMSDAETSGLYV